MLIQIVALQALAERSWIIVEWLPRYAPRRRSEPRTSASRSHTGRLCLPPSSAGSCRPRLTNELGATDAAYRAARRDAATAATPSCSEPCMGTCSSPALGCTAALARAGTARRLCRRCATSYPATSRRGGYTWKRAGRRWCPTPQPPACSPTCCRSPRARTPPPCASTSWVWPSGPRANLGGSNPVSSTAARRSGPGCRSGRTHCRRPGRRLRPGLGRQESQLRTDRRAVHAQGPRTALYRPGARL